MLLKLADVKFQMGSKTNEGGATVMATFIICTVYTCGTVVHLFQVLIKVAVRQTAEQVSRKQLMDIKDHHNNTDLAMLPEGKKDTGRPMVDRLIITELPK